MNTPSHISIHRHNDNAALSFEGVDRTIYLSHEQVTWLARKLRECHKDLNERSFLSSKFGTYAWQEGLGSLTKQGTASLPGTGNLISQAVEAVKRQGTPADFVEVRDGQDRESYSDDQDRDSYATPEEPRKYTVVSVSSNTNSFGYRSVLCLHESGEGVELFFQAYGTEKAPVRGELVSPDESRFYKPCQRSLPSCKPKHAVAIIKEAKGGKQ